MEEALERRIKYYEGDASRYEEQAKDVESRGYTVMAQHLRTEAARFRTLSQKLREGGVDSTPQDSHPHTTVVAGLLS